MRSFLGLILGLAVAILTVMLFQWISHTVWPPPEGLDPKDSAALAEHLKAAPLGSLILVVAGYIVGTFDGVFLGCFIGTAKRYIYAVVIGGLILVGTISTLIMIPHPLWFSASALVGIPLAAWLATMLPPSRMTTFSS